MGLPPGAVQNALTKEGLDPEIINMDPEKSYVSQTKNEDSGPPIKVEYAKFFKVRGFLKNYITTCLSLTSTAYHNPMYFHRC